MTSDHDTGPLEAKIHKVEEFLETLIASSGLDLQFKILACRSNTGLLRACFGARRFGLAFYKAAHSIARLRSAFYPVIDPLAIDVNISRIAARVVITDRLDKATIAL